MYPLSVSNLSHPEWPAALPLSQGPYRHSLSLVAKLPPHASKLQPPRPSFSKWSPQLRMNEPSINIICWNVCDLNSQARKAIVHKTFTSTTCHLVCLQETKLSNVEQNLAGYLGGYNLRSFAHKPTEGTRGGVLLLWNNEYIDVVDVHQSVYNLSAIVSLR